MFNNSQSIFGWPTHSRVVCTANSLASYIIIIVTFIIITLLNINMFNPKYNSSRYWIDSSLPNYTGYSLSSLIYIQYSIIICVNTSYVTWIMYWPIVLEFLRSKIGFIHTYIELCKICINIKIYLEDIKKCKWLNYV